MEARAPYEQWKPPQRVEEYATSLAGRMATVRRVGGRLERYHLRGGPWSRPELLHRYTSRFQNEVRNARFVAELIDRTGDASLIRQADVARAELRTIEETIRRVSGGPEEAASPVTAATSPEVAQVVTDDDAPMEAEPGASQDALSRVRSDDGTLLDARFRVLPEGSDHAVFLEARWGRRGTRDSGNSDYAEGLELILMRLASLDAQLMDATVESTQMQPRPHDERVLDLGLPYPISLALAEPHQLRLTVGRAQAGIGRAPDARGSGNATKRLRLLVRLPDALTPEGLEASLVFGSTTAEVAELFDDVELIAGRRSGQTFSSDVPARQAVEHHAMTITESALVADGWSVEDVSRNESYDFRCTKGDQELRVEVKGSRGPAEQVIVTHGEVKHARDRGDVHIAIVSRITLTRNPTGTPVASGGVLRWRRPWVIDDTELTPIGYTWRVPVETSDGDTGES